MPAISDPMTKFMLEANHRSDITNALKRNSLRLMNCNVSIAQDGDDFIKNVITVLRQYEAYKVPRYLKNHLLKGNIVAIRLNPGRRSN